jgi:hypothetical protein
MIDPLAIKMIFFIMIYPEEQIGFWFETNFWDV